MPSYYRWLLQFIQLKGLDILIGILSRSHISLMYVHMSYFTRS